MPLVCLSHLQTSELNVEHFPDTPMPASVIETEMVTETELMDTEGSDSDNQQHRVQPEQVEKVGGSYEPWMLAHQRNRGVNIGERLDGMTPLQFGDMNSGAHKESTLMHPSSADRTTGLESVDPNVMSPYGAVRSRIVVINRRVEMQLIKRPSGKCQ